MPVAKVSRRGFFGLALGGFAAAAGLPFAARWRRRNTLVTPSWVTRETARYFVTTLKSDMVPLCIPYDRVGDAVRVRLPGAFS